jgi:hypothetical protein
MSPDARTFALAVVALACVGAFVIGRSARSAGLLDRVLAPHTAHGPAVAAASSSEDVNAGARAGSKAPPGNWARLGHALHAALGSHAAPNNRPEWFQESAAERDDRHRTIDRKITETLGEIPKEKRQALMELNDEATEVQLGLQGALMAGKLSQDDFDQQMHQRVMVQLDQLHGVLTDEEYRKMTGLEPGVDPYEYMRTGQGAAQGRPEIETTVPAGAPQKSEHPDAP